MTFATDAHLRLSFLLTYLTDSAVAGLTFGVAVHPVGVTFNSREYLVFIPGNGEGFLEFVTYIEVMSEEVRRNQKRMRIARAVKADELNSDKGFCAICFIRWDDNIDIRRVGKLPCGHIFHLNCLKLWLRSTTTKFNGTCPRCQERFMERCTVLLMPVYSRPRTRSI